MLNNIIAIVAICFTVVGGLWGIGNLLYPDEQEQNNNNIGNNKGGILLIAKDNLFNTTNPTIFVTKNVPQFITVLNKDFVKHDFIVKDLNVNTGFITSEQSFRTAIAYSNSSTFEYYCSLHPTTMKGKIVVN